MLLAATTYSFRELPLAGALDAIAAAGIRHVELWLPHSRDVESTRAELARLGLRAVAVSAGTVGDPDDAVFLRAAELALATDARAVVVCAAPGRLPRLAGALDPRLSLCLENHWNQRVARAPHVMRELAAVPRGRACLDTGHALAVGADPAAFARRLGSLLGHVHLKDAPRGSVLLGLADARLRRRLGRPPAPVFPGRGALDLGALARTLQAAGYAGAVSVEYEGEDPAPAVAALAASWGSALRS